MAEIKTIGVVGGGQMGSGIALVAAMRDVDVWLHDTDPQVLVRATKYISASVQRLVSKGQLSRELESEDIKKILFVQLDKIAKRSCILASNTSSISITRLASSTSRPQQVFFRDCICVTKAFVF